MAIIFLTAEKENEIPFFSINSTCISNIPVSCIGDGKAFILLQTAIVWKQFGFYVN